MIAMTMANNGDAMMLMWEMVWGMQGQGQAKGLFLVSGGGEKKACVTCHFTGAAAAAQRAGPSRPRSKTKSKNHMLFQL
jgi:hypothetical protein